MDIGDLKISHKPSHVGREIYRFISELYPIHRSLTGDGIRETIRLIKEHIPLLATHEVPTGTEVFDWTIPKEWNIRDAYVKNSKGQRVIDFKKCNLHVVAYSIPVKRKMSLNELKGHLFTLPEYPDWIPYRYSYHDQNWGFCLSHRQLLDLKDEAYEVCIDATLSEGHLTYGEYYLKGESSEEVLVSSHVCHPSLCNDNLSGVALATYLAKYLSSVSPRYSYRFVFGPAMIGAITWLCRNETQVSKIEHGLVLACVGDPGRSTYKKSRRGDAEIDRAFIHVLKHSGDDYEILNFFPYGYDERQFCSPAFNLPVGCLMRTPHDRFPEYHTSADNLDFVRPDALADSFYKCLSVFTVLENNRRYLNQNPKCEPHLGKRGLYRTIAGQADRRTRELPTLWVLNLSDGEHTLLDIAERSGFSFDSIKEAADELLKHELLEEIREKAAL